MKTFLLTRRFAKGFIFITPTVCAKFELTVYLKNESIMGTFSNQYTGIYLSVVFNHL